MQVPSTMNVAASHITYTGNQPTFSSNLSSQRRESPNNSSNRLASKYEELRKHLSSERIKDVWDYVDELKESGQYDSHTFYRILH